MEEAKELLSYAQAQTQGIKDTKSQMSTDSSSRCQSPTIHDSRTTMTKNNNTQGTVITTTPEDRAEIYKDPETRCFNIYIEDPDGLWVYDWGEILCNSEPSYVMFRDFLKEDLIESRLESLDHDCYGSTTPSATDFVLALTFPECVTFQPLEMLTFDKYMEQLSSNAEQKE